MFGKDKFWATIKNEWDRIMNMNEDPKYIKFIEELADHCYCCEICHDVPCGGVLAGGFCDDICFCEECEIEL